MLMNALIMASLAGFSLSMLFSKLPKWVQKFLLKHALLTDVLLMLSTISVFGMTATGILCGAMLDVIATCLIYMAAHAEDYEYLVDARDFIAEQLHNLNEVLKQYGRTYHATKHGAMNEDVVAA